MEPIKNKVSEGLHLDFNPFNQPVNTMRDNRNGIITDLEDGSHVWANLNGTSLIFELDPNDNIMANCWIRERLFLIVLNIVKDYVVIYEALYDETGDFTSLENRWEGSNTELNLSLDHPIRAIFGFYENDKVQRIYWTDNFNPPRVINVKDDNRVTIEEKFANFFPIIDPGYGTFTFDSLVAGGNCKAGIHFFAWRLFKEGYYTDWSYLSSGVPVLETAVMITYDAYQEMQGAAPNEVTSKKIRIVLSDLDTDYDSIQVAAFYSNDYNSAQAGVIFYDGDISGTSMTLDYLGNENLGTVTIDDLLETTVVIETCKDMAHIKKRNIFANIKEREEIDVSGVHSEGKNNEMEVTMEPIRHGLMLDSTGYPGNSWSTGNKALSAIKNGMTEMASVGDLYPFIYYKAVTECTFDDGAMGTRTIPAGNIFKLEMVLDVVDLTTGSAKPITFKSKYRPASAGAFDLNTNVSETKEIYNDYYNFKNPYFVNNFRGYPRGETVRLGVTFFDKTGRPFFTRHLYNTETSFGGLYNIGPGDFTSSPPGDGSTYGGLSQTHYAIWESLVSDIPKAIVGSSLGIRVSGIDITDIKDKIGGFSIVRAPIERQRVAYGVLNGMIAEGASSNDIKVKAPFRNVDSDADLYDKGYSFWCPEDMFNFTGFSIQPGDKIRNEYYLTPCVADESEQVNFNGMGREESDSYCLYQKFLYYTDDTGAGTNGELLEEHEVSVYTKYQIGDASAVDGIVIDPSNANKLFFDETTFAGLRSHATRQGIIIFDELEASGTNIKGKHNLSWSNPQLLMCSVFRENSNPYGGLGDSALANTLYIGTGHYQEINDDVLNDIYDGANYIFNDIDIYGGDTYVCMFDFMHMLKNEDRLGVYSGFNHSVIVPIETRINLDYREGDHIAKNRSYDTSNTDGMRRNSTKGHNWDDFNYNDGYSSDNIDDYYLALPYNFRLENKFDARMRYSAAKSYGELEDNFRKFSALNYMDVSTEYGSITNIKSKFSKVIYWQRDAVGYIPINERALSTNQFGDPVQLGVGGIFERYDEMIDKLGNSNQFGLVESNAGFHWYDAVRKVFVSIANNLQFSHDSIAKGLDSFFVNDIPNNMDQYDFTSPNINFGIVGGFDIRNKLIFVTFRMPGELFETICYNIKKNKFIGFFDFKVRRYFNWKDYLYSIDDNLNNIHQHGIGSPGMYHGVFYNQYFEIIVKEQSNLPIIYDNFEFISSQDTFKQLVYEDQLGASVSDLINNSRNIKFRNKRYYGNFPRIERERLSGGYIKMKFINDSTTSIWFEELKTYFRKMI